MYIFVKINKVEKIKRTTFHSLTDSIKYFLFIPLLCYLNCTTLENWLVTVVAGKKVKHSLSTNETWRFSLNLLFLNKSVYI